VLKTLFSILKFKVSTFSYLVLIIVAFYVLSARICLLLLPDYKADIEAYLSAASGQVIQVQSFSSHWKGLDPVIDINGLSINGVDSAYVGRVRFQLSFFRSILSLSPRLKRVTIEHAEVAMRQGSEGDWSIGTYSLSPAILDAATADETSSDKGYAADSLERAKSSDQQSGQLGFLSTFDSTTINLNDVSVAIHNNKSLVRALRSPNISLNYKDDRFFASGQILETDGDNALLNFSLEGQGVQSTLPVQGEIYIEARSSEFFGQILKVYNWEKLSIEDVEASTRAWLSFEGLSLKAIQGDLQLSQLNWRAAKESLPPLNNLALSYQWEYSDQYQLFSVNDLGFSWGGQECGGTDIVFAERNNEMLVQASQVDINCVSRLAAATGLLPDNLNDRIEISDPAGDLRNIQVRLTSGETPEDLEFELEAELKQVSLAAYDGTPSVKGVDGYVFSNLDGGFVKFSSTNFELGFPDLFVDPWKMKKTEGLVSWLVEGSDVDIRSDGLRLLQFDDSLVYGDFFLKLNPDDREDYLSLAIAMQDISFQNATNFVPLHIIGEDLHSWLGQALISGSVSEGIYYGYGSTESDSPDNSFTSSIFLRSADGQFNFSDDWPNLNHLDSDIFIQNTELLLEADTAYIVDTKLDDLSAKLVDSADGKSSALNIYGSAITSPAIQKYWLMESPIAEHTTQVAEKITIEGDVIVDIKLGVPISGEGSEGSDISYEITTNLNSIDVFHKDSDLLFEEVVGQLAVSSQSGIHAEDVHTKLFGQDAVLTISSESSSSVAAVSPKPLLDANVESKLEDSPAVHQTILNLVGSVQVGSLFEFLGYDKTANLTGELEYDAVLSLPSEEASFPTVDISSNLIGVERDWPEPLRKSVLDDENLDLTLLLKPDQTYLSMNLKTHNDIDIESEMLFVDGKFSFGELLCGGAEVTDTDILGLNIAANLASVEVTPWIDFVDVLTEDFSDQRGESAVGTESKALIRQVQLKLNKLSAYDQIFNKVDVQIEQKGSLWAIDLVSSDLQGQIVLPGDDTDLDIQFDHVFFNTKVQAQNGPSGIGVADEQQYDPRSLPALSFSSKQVVVDNQNFGAWSATVEPSEQGAIFRNLKGLAKGSQLIGQLNWQYFEEGQHNSILTMNVEGDKIEDLLQTFDITPLVTSERYTSSIAVVWPSHPLAFELDALSGKLTLDMEDGFLKTEDEKTGVLRLFGILSADSIMRRLKLDFSDLYKSGVGYDTFSIKSSMDQGLMSITEPLTIKGPAGNYVINGKVDLAAKSLDLDVLVELPFSQTVPLAALVLGAPQIGGVVWVVDKLLGEPLSALTTSRYDITGLWENPVMELQEAMNASKKERPKGSGVRDSSSE